MSYVDNLSGQFGELGIGAGRPGSQPYQPHPPGKGFVDNTPAFIKCVADPGNISRPARGIWLQCFQR